MYFVKVQWKYKILIKKILYILEASSVFRRTQVILEVGKLISLFMKYIINITTWFMEPGGSIPYSQGLSNNPYP